MEKGVQKSKKTWYNPEINEIRVSTTKTSPNRASFSNDSYAEGTNDVLLGEIVGGSMLRVSPILGSSIS